MISKLVDASPLSLKLWAQSVQQEFNQYLNSLFVPVSTLGTGAMTLHGRHSAIEVQVGETAYMETVIPRGLNSFKEAGIRIIPTTTGTINYTVNFSYGSVGADENVSTKTASVTLKAVTDDQVMELDLPISTFFTDLDRDDQLGIEFVLDAVVTTVNVYVLGFYLKYI